MSSKTLNDEFNSLCNSKEYKVDYDLLNALSHEGLRKKDYIEICRRLKRPPNRTELGMFGVMWSEHCCYRNSKPLLQSFPTKSTRILVGPGENAGVVDLGFGQQLAFKIESHNHPSALEPFQGAATGVGGILRDIFTMGARPIALLNALRFGPLEDKKNINLMKGVVSGIAHYGNCVGVPTIGGEVNFDKSYSGNPLVNAMALGLMETKEIVCSGASGVGYPVIYVGSTTGRDGMGGASFASAELTNTSLEDRPAVQVGDPFLEKGLIEACLEAFKSGDVIAAQDMGAAGLTCSCSEMAAKGGLGIELNLDYVPAREEGMSAYEFLLSESQERMLFVVKPGKEKVLMERFTRRGLQVAVVGKVLKDNVVRVLHKGNIAADLPASALADDTPVNKHKLLDEPPDEYLLNWKWDENQLPQADYSGIRIESNQNSDIISWNKILLKLLDYPSIASKLWVYNQYDQQVQANTVILPGLADAAVIRLRPQEGDKSIESMNRGVAAVVDCPNRWAYLDPERGAMAAVAESARNLTCVGAEPIAITNNLNFASPETSIGYWQLAMACKGISKACEVLKTPVTGGNVSLYNETRLSNGELLPIHPTPVIGMVGIIDNLTNTCLQGWLNKDDYIWLVGLPLDTSFKDDRLTLSASSYLECIHQKITGRPPIIDLELEKLVQSFVRKSIHDGYINSCHDVSDGGLAVALAECCIFSGLGAHCEFSGSDLRLDRLLFAEGGARILMSISSEKEDKWLEMFNEFNNINSGLLNVTKIGRVNDLNTLVFSKDKNKLIDISIATLKDSFYNSIPRRISNNKISSS